MSKYVQIKDGLLNGKTVYGEYPFIAKMDGDSKCKRELYVRVVINGKEVNVHVNDDDIVIVDKAIKKTNPLASMSASDIELDRRIQLQFDIMARLTNMAIKGHVRSFMISGAPGIGKSHNLEQRLNEAIDNDEIAQFNIIKGKVSAIALFKELFEAREEGSILVLDDTDVIFEDDAALNLLKAALDTGDRRTLSWLTAASWLEEHGVDQTFEFNGTCIFITNLDFDRMLERGTNLANHFRALISRSIYLDLGIHTNKEILMRINWVVNNTSMLDVHGIDDSQKDLMMAWIYNHYENMRELSLRTILKLAYFIKGDPDGWRDIAEATMIKNTGFTVASLPIPPEAIGGTLSAPIPPARRDEPEEALM